MSDIAFDIIGRDRASAAFRNVGKSAATANKSVTGFGTSLKEHVGKFAALTGVSLGAGALIGFAKSSIETEAKFSTSMRLIKASSGATSAQMQQMNKLAIDLGQKTVFSANEAADAMLELSKAGISTKDIMKGAADGTLLLASAGGTDLTTAATIASNAMNAFNLKGRDMGKIAAALAGGANASSASVESLGLGLAQVGPGARNAGLSLQETVAALSAFDAAGIKGSDAGTSLKTMLTRLIPMTKKSSVEMERLGLFSAKTGSAFVNADGSFKNLTQISGLLHAKLSKLTQAQRAQALAIIFGSDATRAATVLMNDGAKGIGKYLKAANDQTAAMKMQKAATSGTAGALSQLSGSIDTAKLKLGQALAPAVVKTANYLARNLVPAMDSAIGMAKDFGKTLGVTVAPPLKVLGDILGPIAKFFGDLPGPIKSTALEAGLFALVLPRLQAGATAATTAIKDQITYMRVLRLEMMESASSGNLLSSTVAKMGGAMKTAAGIGGMLALSQSAQESNKSVALLEKTAGMAAIGFSIAGPWGAAIGGAVGLLGSLNGAFGGATTAAHRNAEILRKTSSAQIAADAYDDLRSTLNKATGAYTNNTRAAIENWLQTNEVGKAARDAAASAGISERTLIAAVMGSPEANARIGQSITAKIRAATVEATRLTNQATNLSNSFFQKNPGATALSQSVQNHIDKLGADVQALKDQKTALEQVRRTLGAEGGTLRQAAKDQRSFYAAVTPVNRILHVTKKAYEATFSKRVRGELDLSGVPKTLGDIKRVASSAGGLTRKGWTVLLKAAGIDVTARQLNGLAKTGKSAGRDTGAGYMSGAMAAIANSVPALKNTASQAVAQAASAARGKATSSGSGIGYNLSAGTASGIRNGNGLVSAAAGSVIDNAIETMRAHAHIKSPSRKTMKVGNQLGDGLRVGLRAKVPGIGKAGVDLIESLVKGIKNHKVKVKDVLGDLTSYIDKQTSKISDLAQKRQGIIQSIQGFSSSVFGASFQDAEGNDRMGSIQDLIAFQAQQRDQAVQLQHDIQSLIGKHVSASLLQQMQNEGAAGLANIHTLAGASAAQIAQINALNSQTSAAGAAGGNAISGALGINSQLSQAEKDKATAEAMAAAFRKVLREEHKDQHVYVYLNGKHVHTVLLEEKAKQRKGLNLG